MPRHSPKGRAEPWRLRFASLTTASYGTRIFSKKRLDTSRDVHDVAVSVWRSWRLEVTYQIEVIVKRLSLAAFITVFVALVVTCSFEGPHVADGSPAASGHGASFCGIIHAATALTIPASEPAPQTYWDERIQPPSDIHSMWPLARAIDHPPRVLGQPY
jgi:hypothetical protein